MTALWWIRRDFRLSDNRALVRAAEQGAVIPVFIRDQSVEDLGAAPKWRLGLGLAHLMERIADKGGRVILRSGAAKDVLSDLVAETGASGVYWNRLYDKDSIARDTNVKEALKDAGIEAHSSNAHLLFEPWTVETKTGGYYKVYSPFWRAVKDREVDTPLKSQELSWPKSWPESEALDDWALGAAMKRGAAVVEPYCHVGEEAAMGRLSAFIQHHAEDYKARRDFPAEPVCSGLSENLTYGEISPRTIWHAGRRAMEEGAKGAEHFVKELVWREFAYHLLYHEPDLATKNHRGDWDAFPWSEDERRAEVKAWKQGRTGIRFVDAAMQEMYVTGTMHNRARMIVASYLTKHLMVHWRVGRAWFEECLIDWDPASNAMGWQWVAGCGPDAAPYFRIFNPDRQVEKFDPDETYLRRWLAEGASQPTKTALSYFEAVPKSWALSSDDSYPDPVVGLKEGRERALEAYAQLKG